jgi:hypothetical protein
MAARPGVSEIEGTDSGEKIDARAAAVVLWGEPAHESATRRMEVRGNKSGDDGNGFSHVLGPVWGKMMLMRAAQRCKPQNSNTSRSTAVWGVYRTDQCASAGGLGGLTPAPHRVGPTTCPHLRKLANVQNLQTHRTTSVLIPEQIRDFWRGLGHPLAMGAEVSRVVDDDGGKRRHEDDADTGEGKPNQNSLPLNHACCQLPASHTHSLTQNPLQI